MDFNKYNPIVLVLIALAIGLYLWRRFGISVINIVDQLPKSDETTYSKRGTFSISRYVIHHTAGPQTQSIEEIAKFHVETRGWPGIAYHYMIDPAGFVYKTQEEETISFHVANNNTPSLGIALIGNFTEHDPTPAQLRALRKLLQRLKGKFSHIKELRKHGELTNTSCPGRLNIEPFKKIIS